MNTWVYVAMSGMPENAAASKARIGARMRTEMPRYARYMSNPRDNTIPMTPTITILQK